jgi:beta-glucosidase
MTMKQPRVSRRSMLISGAVMTAWTTSPVSAMLRSIPPGRDATAIETLIGQMTLEEKAGQLSLMASAWGGGAATALNPAGDNGSFATQVADAVAGKLTGVFNGRSAAMALQMQRAVVSGSRLKIPLIFAADIIHGHRTIFPVPVAEAASFEPLLAERTARVAAFEAAGSGVDWTFAPMVDIARDQRWGRTMEGAGEDVLLGRLFAAARVRGFQGKSLSDDDAVLACAKHFAAYGAAEAGLDYNSVDVSERTLREIYLRPFKAAFDAGALSTMASFNEISGLPSTGNKWLMTDLLRGEWGFQGFVVSDYTGDEEMILGGFAKDRRDAARIAFLAGVDISMQSGVYAEYLPGLVRDGSVPQALLDTSVRRVLAMKARLGLFDDPFRRIDLNREKIRSRLPASLALAREAAVKSCVLLKNDGALLPLSPTAKIALIGPFAMGQHDLNGPWVVYGDDAQAIDFATGMRSAMAGRGSLTVVEGSGVMKPTLGGIDAAVAAARAADIVVLALGESEDMSGEAKSRTDIIVPAPQQALAEAVAATSKPVVVVLKNGRALALTGAIRDARAILVSWFLGSEGGHALADLIFGKASPSGRLPMSFPIASGQEPYHYDHKPTGRPNPAGPLEPYKAHFQDVPNEALYPFGHGLTYGEIAYSGFKVAPTMAWNGQVSIAATITNHGRRSAEEVVQLYVHDKVGSVTRPVRELKAFRKLSLAPGASETIRFTLSRDDLMFIGRDNRPTVEPGMFDVWIAPSAQVDGVAGGFELLAG